MTELMYQYVDNGVRNFPNHPAIEEPGKGTITYGELGALAGSLRDCLRSLGVSAGDRVGIYMHKSIDSIASLLGIMKAGAAYVPVDPLAPIARGAYILNDCTVKVVITEKCFADELATEIQKLGGTPHFIIIDATGGGIGLGNALKQMVASIKTGGTDQSVSPDSLAYILYTSGSTGKPKGVMISHRNGTGFVNWCIETFKPLQSDRFSAHAPLHFDLSIFDIYVAFSCGGTLVVISEETGKEPVRLARLISESRISIWYSAPSILTYLVQYGSLEKWDCSSIRLLFFAGEVFPVKHLRALKGIITRPRYFNLYGPTETNVCTFHEIPKDIPIDRSDPFPIGRVCKHLRGKTIDENGAEVILGERGELCIKGDNVMQGYWNLPEQSGRCFLELGKEKWYRTGDIVVEETDGTYLLIGRRDRMVKRRGYRVELGEIEAALYRHPNIGEAAVVATPDEETGVRIRAFLSCKNGKRPSTIEMKQFCMQVLPPYMVPDLFSFLEALPKTSTDKVDYQTLRGRA